MKLLTLNIDNKEVKVKAQKINGITWVYYNRKILSLANKKASHGSTASGLQDPSKILAPMPGAILKISTNDDHQYLAGHTLIVMEAMKMEYSLKVIANATLTKLNCAVGDQVTQGQVLAQLEPEASHED
ncbi:MAG: hypothetical protein HOO06_13055 [Bdellovibrionaceae bacterium]|jgi:acetyl/propionyl-CoA carboxylase alpha subunit|nr:hypothetical protein [Pseudobdellovibrionaceae bacterium]